MLVGQSSEVNAFCRFGMSALVRSARDSVIRCWFQPVDFRDVFRSLVPRDLSVSQISFPRVRGVGKDDEPLKWRGQQGMI